MSTEFGHDRAKTTPDTVADNRGSDFSSNSERDSDPSRRTISRPVHDSKGTTSDGPAVTAQCMKITAVSESADQADSRLRPFCRRFRIMARPALVRILRRNPCLRDRRRLLGWNVLFIGVLLSAARRWRDSAPPGESSSSFRSADVEHDARPDHERRGLPAPHQPHRLKSPSTTYGQTSHQNVLIHSPHRLVISPDLSWKPY